jgi:hypothetical protein
MTVYFFSFYSNFNILKSTIKIKYIIKFRSFKIGRKLLLWYLNFFEYKKNNSCGALQTFKPSDIKNIIIERVYISYSK